MTHDAFYWPRSGSAVERSTVEWPNTGELISLRLQFLDERTEAKRRCIRDSEKEIADLAASLGKLEAERKELHAVLAELRIRAPAGKQ